MGRLIAGAGAPTLRGGVFATIGEVLGAADLVVLARRTAGLSQAELAHRLGRPRSTIARWELGEMEPSYAAVTQALRACELAAVVELAAPDDSYLGQVGELLRLSPIERVRRLAGPVHVEQLGRLAAANIDGVLFGDVAAVLAGWPLSLPSSSRLELCAHPHAAAVRVPEVELTIDACPPGTRGLRDLRRDRERVVLEHGQGVWIASPLDLLRIEQARGHRVQAGALLAVLEHRRRFPNGPTAQRAYTEQQASEAVEAWLATSP